MNIKKFVDLCNAIDNRNEFVQEHIKNIYIPYEQKAIVAKAIVDTSYWIKEQNEDGIDTHRLHVDSIAKHMLTQMSIVDLYTDIERNRDDILDDFNSLNRSRILDLIISNINQRELDEFKMVLDLTCQDLIANEYENHAFISKQVDRLINVLNGVLAPIISQLDLDKIQEVINEMK